MYRPPGTFTSAYMTFDATFRLSGYLSLFAISLDPWPEEGTLEGDVTNAKKYLPRVPRRCPPDGHCYCEALRRGPQPPSLRIRLWHISRSLLGRLQHLILDEDPVRCTTNRREPLSSTAAAVSSGVWARSSSEASGIRHPARLTITETQAARHHTVVARPAAS